MFIFHKDKWNFNIDITKYPLRKNISISIDFKARYISFELWNIQVMIGYYNWNKVTNYEH